MVKVLLDWLHSYQLITHICCRPVPASTRKLLLLRVKLIWNKFWIKIKINSVKALHTILYYKHNILWSKFWIITASDSLSSCALRYAWATCKLLTICCLRERKFALGLSRRWNWPRVSDHGLERLLHQVVQNIISIANRRCYVHGSDSCQT